MDTKTYEDWAKYVGEKPKRIGVVARMYTTNTLNFLTDGLKNVFYNNEKANKYLLTDSLVFLWDIENNQIKHVEFAKEPEGIGENGSEILMYFNENYYLKFDIFRIDETKQQCLVVRRPIRMSDGLFLVSVRLIDNTFDTILDTTGTYPGMTTTFLSTANTELSEEGENFELLSSVKLAA